MGTDDELIPDGHTSHHHMICSFSTFEKLKKLSISAHLLLASSNSRTLESCSSVLATEWIDTSALRLSNLLPSSIVELKIVDCDIHSIAHNILELLDRKYEFPKLKSIVLVARKNGYAGLPGERGGSGSVASDESDGGRKDAVLEDWKAREWRETEEKTRVEMKLREEMEVAAWENGVELELVIVEISMGNVIRNGDL
jgi:hypothetical protein